MNDTRREIVKICSQLKAPGVHSVIRMQNSGFKYTGVGDTARCDACGLEVSGWIREKDPFHVHVERNPDCSFVRSVQFKNLSTFNHDENTTKRQKKDSNTDHCSNQSRLIEADTLKQIRRRTFSHWSQETMLLKKQMIAAGFFGCNVGNRVICLYCNLICQQWKENIDDPVEVHKTISPKCPYVLSILIPAEHSSILIVNEILTDNDDNQRTSLNNINQTRIDQIVHLSACHIGYTTVLARQATFETWNDETTPPVGDLVKAGFFYTGVKNCVQCFYCGGSLQNWSKNDNPLIEHIRWFPHCGYAKQLSGNELYNKVQEAKKIQQG